MKDKKTKPYVKSPMNYIGNKYKLLDKLFEHFPKDTDCFVDLFCGGCDVAVNYELPSIKITYANDINYHIIELYEYLQRNDICEIRDYIHSQIVKFQLCKMNEQGFIEYRNWYNKSNNRSPIDLFLLTCYSFNRQIRFNNNHEYNSSFGKDRYYYREIYEDGLIAFHQLLNNHNINFSKQDFVDFDYSILDKYSNSFIYCDPPYRLGCAAYNDGKRGFRGWSENDDRTLLYILNELTNYGTRFALSNVIEHKGETNDILIEWIKKYDYNLIPMNYNYDNCNYQAKNKEFKTKEVLITNY